MGVVAHPSFGLHVGTHDLLRRYVARFSVFLRQEEDTDTAKACVKVGECTYAQASSTYISDQQLMTASRTSGYVGLKLAAQEAYR